MASVDLQYINDMCKVHDACLHVRLQDIPLPLRTFHPRTVRTMLEAVLATVACREGTLRRLRTYSVIMQALH